ncbi:DMT family transporter [Gordonibacter massiliensis (ex Traore et al. 2017)]|uniref:DMT family transporter n=1 Tax=Gordonibacter massiliensis (ex Traore et al. 2017) TaxID=1841863 RepID=UPI001FE6F4CA|nr:DMT family transporter [Gordonibacter massiliensis (ex Traore et al. 2017)]
MARIVKTSASLPLWTYKAFLLVAAAIWGLGTVVIKSTVDAFPPAWIVGVRFTAAGIILGIIMLPRFRKRIDADHLRKGAVLGVLVFLSYWSNSTGLTDTTGSNSSFLTSLYCVIIPFLGWALRGPRPTRFNIAAAVVCVAGVGCVSFASGAGFSLRFGDLITLLSALFLSFHVIYTSKFAPGCDMTLLTVIQFLVAGVLGLAAGLAFEPLPNFAELGADTWTSLAYLAVFASCVALLLQNLAVAHVDPAPASLFLATESVFGVLFSVLFLGELLTAPLFAGFALIFAGIVVSEYLPQRAVKKAAGEAEAAPEAERPEQGDEDSLANRS